MSTLTAPKPASARRRSIGNLPRTPDRPIVHRNRSNSSTSTSTPGSVFDEDIVTDSPHSPLTPFASPSGKSNGFLTPSPAQKDYTFGDQTLFTIEGRPTKTRKSPNDSESPTAHKKNHATRKSESSVPTLKLPRDTPSDQTSDSPRIDSYSTGESSTSKSITRPRLARETYETNIKSYQSDEDSGDDSEYKQPLDKRRGRKNNISGTVVIGGEAKILHSTDATPAEQDQTDAETLDSDIEYPDLTNSKEEQQPKTSHLSFSQYGNKKTPHTYNFEICRYILDQRKKNPTPKAASESEAKGKAPLQPGYVYIFKSPNLAPSHVKIGITKNDPSSRLKTIEKQCEIDLEIVKQEHQGFFLHYRCLEHIVHLALHSDRRQYPCYNCKKKDRCVHQEWFEISHEKALEEVKLWRDWILVKKPFHDDGTLTHYWYWRANKLSASYDKVCWEDWTRSVGIHRLSYVDYLIEMLEGHRSRLQKHMERKDMWFFQMGTIFSLLVCMKFGCWGMFLAVVALCML